MTDMNSSFFNASSAWNKNCVEKLR